MDLGEIVRPHHPDEAGPGKAGMEALQRPRRQPLAKHVLDVGDDEAGVRRDLARPRQALGEGGHPGGRLQRVLGRHQPPDRIEAQMKTFDAAVNDGLAAISNTLGDAAKPSIDQASAAYADFQKVNSEILVLSRRNSNVRSLALSLCQKRNVSAECEDRLTAIQESLKNERVAATR